MKILPLSDLHTEIHAFVDHFHDIGQDADVIVLAGDIGLDDRGLQAMVRTLPPKPIVYVAGNHEFYGGEMSRVRYNLRTAAAAHGVHFLDNSEVVIDGVRFLGGTLWTDYALYGEHNVEVSRRNAVRCMNDYYWIKAPDPETGDIEIFSPKVALAEHARTKRFLAERLQQPHLGKTVVVTHMAPSIKSIHPSFAAEVNTNPCYASNLDALAELADLWVHGHVHNSFDYQIGKCRVVANPRGYHHWARAQENPDFTPYMLLELP